MNPDLILVVLGVLLVGVGLISGWMAWSFYHLRRTVYVSIGEAGELLVLISKWYSLENPEQKAARILKMDPDTLKLEIERGNIMVLIARRAESILTGLKVSVPDAEKLIHQIEDDIEDKAARGG